MDKWFDDIVNNHYNKGFGFRWREFGVFDLTFMDDTVTADVGNDEDVHHVKITFRQFSVLEKDELLRIASKPEVRHDLIKGIVPEELFSCGVKVFPSSGIDLIVDCTCWASGFLCNESMAVLNRLNDIFKRDPFLIFSLRGFNLTDIDSFPVREFDDIFNNSYNTNLAFLLDDYLKDGIGEVLDHLNRMIESYDFKSKPCKLHLPLNIDSAYQITNNSFKHEGEFVSALKSMNNPILDYALELIGNHDVFPEIFKINDKHIRTRWICRKPEVNVLEELVTVNGEEISKSDQINVFISLIIDDLLSLVLKHHNIGDEVSKLLVKSSAMDTNRIKTLVSDMSRNLSVFNMKHDYQISVSDTDDAFILDFSSSDDLDSLRYANHIRKLFRYFKLYWTLNEPLKLDYRGYIKYLNRIECYLDDLNVEVKKSFNLYDGSFRIKLALDENDFLTVNNISSSNWMIDLGNCLITTEEFQKLDIDETGIVKINNDYYRIDPVKFKSLKSDTLFLPTNFESYELLQIALLGRYRNLKFDVGDQFKELLDFQGKLPQPDTLKGKLRPYQVTGYSWLVQNIKSGFGSILADDMGLGKSVQVLSAILYLKENSLLDGKQVLIVAPTTLIANWENEITKFTDLTYSVYHADERKIDSKAELILTSYGMIRQDEAKFKRRSWFLCVIDEAQNIKNPKTKQTRSVKNIKADNRIALTGTPIENRLLDYWSIFDFTNKGYLPNISKFKKEYVNPVSKNPNSRVLDNLKLITKPFILRRLKTDRSIIDDLPEKNVNDIYTVLTPKQSEIYDELVKTGLSELKKEDGIKRKGNILKLITSLKQVCNHPVQYLKKGDVDIADSAKLELLAEIVGNILDVGEKTIIFTQYVEMGKIIKEVLLKMFNREVLFLHGSLNRKTREKIISNFQNDPSYPILIATLKTGGVGLNLTSARNVIHYDLWWNPAVENQATDRAYRIGQVRDVMVYRFITRGTLEEKIDLTLKNKLELADRTVESNETFITELSDDELKEMLELRL